MMKNTFIFKFNGRKISNNRGCSSIDDYGVMLLRNMKTQEKKEIDRIKHVNLYVQTGHYLAL